MRKMIFKVFYNYDRKYSSPEAVVNYFEFDCMDSLMTYFKSRDLTVLYAKEVVDADEMAEFERKVGA
jgi:hypothetical protein